MNRFLIDGHAGKFPVQKRAIFHKVKDYSPGRGNWIALNVESARARGMDAPESKQGVAWRRTRVHRTSHYRGIRMTDFLQMSPGMQRLFRDEHNHYILLHKAGIAVSFWIDQDGSIRVTERLKGVDFKATGTELKKEGWKCLGPGMTYARLLREKG